jgi:transcriptional regulator with XRE-family HTH domain
MFCLLLIVGTSQRHRTSHCGYFCSDQLGRAEAVPSADVFNRISKALEVSPDYLLNGTIQDKAKNNIQDSELLLQFEKVEKLNDQKKSLVKEFLDAFILKSNLQQQLS